MHCTNCGKKNPVDANYCMVCGTQLQDRPPFADLIVPTASGTASCYNISDPITGVEAAGLVEKKDTYKPSGSSYDGDEE